MTCSNNVQQGMLEGVLDVSWTCDQTSVLGAGNDKSIRVWDPTTGRVRHTMTGHTGKVRVAAFAAAGMPAIATCEWHTAWRLRASCSPLCCTLQSMLHSAPLGSEKFAGSAVFTTIHGSTNSSHDVSNVQRVQGGCSRSG